MTPRYAGCFDESVSVRNEIPRHEGETADCFPTFPMTTPASLDGMHPCILTLFPSVPSFHRYPMRDGWFAS